MQKLYKNFSKIDKDKNGTLEPEEFFDIPGKTLNFNSCFTLFYLELGSYKFARASLINEPVIPI